MNTLSVAGRAGAISQQVALADATAWGQALEATTRTIAVLAVTCFVAGEQLGRWVHQLNQQLAAAYRCLLVGRQKATAAVHATWQGLPLTCFSVVELRTLARQRGIKAVGNRRVAQARRADLLVALA